MEFKTFETFLDSERTLEARNELVSIVKGIGERGERIALVGPAGSGKTHLLHAMSVHRTLTGAGSDVMYVNASEFKTVADAVSVDNVTELSASFLDRMGSCEVLALDDVDALGGELVAIPMLQLLIDARSAQGLTTVVASKVLVEALPDEDLRQVLAGFRETEIDAVPITPGLLSERARLIMEVMPDQIRRAFAPGSVEALAQVCADQGADIARVLAILSEVAYDAGPEGITCEMARSIVAG